MTARVTHPKPKMTAAEAVTFETISETNAHILMMAAHARGCQCMPYSDWFTFNRWQAQGFQVQKGEHGVCLTTYIPIKDKDSDEVKYRRPHKTYVFCRHQVKPVEGARP